MQLTKELIDEIYRDRVQRARQMSPEDKFFAGARLFDRSCRIMVDGSRVNIVRTKNPPDQHKI